MRRTRVGLLMLGTILLAGQWGGAQAPAAGWRLVRVRTSLLGTHYWYQQTHRGIDVLGGVLVRHVYDDADLIVRNRGRALGRDVGVNPSVSRAAALATAAGTALEATLAIAPGPDPRLVWQVFSNTATGSIRTVVDAETGAVQNVERLARDFSGTGRVFNPNPIVTLQNPDLRDQDNADYPALAGAYQLVTLQHLDGSGFLRGDFAVVTGPPETAFSSDLTFTYDRSSPFFEQTMAYYHATTSQEYIQALGFAGPTAINATPQRLIANAFPFDQSFYDPVTDAISLGEGGVDDGEDADVINHEYGHAIHEDVIPGFGASEDARAIGEGLSDYWAIVMSQPVNGGYDVPCMADWDASSDAAPPGAHCLIRTDSDITTADRNGEPHHDGQIFSRALWDVNLALGRDVATTILLESLFVLPSDMSFDEAAAAMIDTAFRLFGRTAAREVSGAFAARGIGGRQRPDRPPPPSGGGAAGFREIARVFTQGPGDLGYENVFEPYALDGHGQALFASDVSTGGQAVFLADPYAVSIVARSGDPAPGGGVLGAGVLPGPGLSPQGEVALSYVLEPFLRPFGFNSGVYRWSRGALAALVVPGVTPSPAGNAFVGAVDKTAINAAGVAVFSGMVPTTLGISGNLGVGVFLASTYGGISTVAAPGDAAPGGGVFDYASEPAINARGDIAFTGHVAGTPCLTNIPQTIGIGCVRDLFVRAAVGTIRRVTGVGSPAPGGGQFRDIRYPVINAVGDILFRGVVTNAGVQETGYFLSRGADIVRIARSGDAMPGGGAFLRAASQAGNWDLNDRGDVSFSARLDTFNEETGFGDQGLYRWSNGVLTLITRTGATVPAGTVLALQPLGLLGISVPFSGAALNDSRQVLFQVTVITADGDLDTVLYVKE